MKYMDATRAHLAALSSALLSVRVHLATRLESRWREERAVEWVGRRSRHELAPMVGVAITNVVVLLL